MKWKYSFNITLNKINLDLNRNRDFIVRVWTNIFPEIQDKNKNMSRKKKNIRNIFDCKLIHKNKTPSNNRLLTLFNKKWF